MLNKNNIDSTAMRVAMGEAMLRKKSRRALEESAYGKKFYDAED